MSAAQTQIRARITRVGSEYREAVTSGTCKLCITDWAARSSHSASLRPSRPAPAPPKWLSASTAPISTTMTGTRSSLSSSPDALRVTPTKGERSLVDARTIREGRPFLSRKARRARRENGEKRSAKRPRKNSSPVTLVTVPQEFSISGSCETSCVNGRAHATARRRFLSHFPGDHERAWGRSRYPSCLSDKAYRTCFAMGIAAFLVCSKWQSEMTCDICLGWALWRVGIAACPRALPNVAALMGGLAALGAGCRRVAGVLCL